MEPKKILIIRRDNIGDLVCTTPLLQVIRRRFPEARVDMLVNSYNAPVLAGHSGVDNLYIYTKAKHTEQGKSKLAVYWHRVKLIMELRCNRYDLVMLASSTYSVYLMRWVRQIGAKKVVGFCETVQQAKRFAYPLTLSAELRDKHEVEKILFLAQPFIAELDSPPLSLAAPPQAIQQAQKQLSAAGLSLDNKLIGLHISARKLSQRWPAERFITLIHLLAKRYPAMQFALFWSPGSSSNLFHPGDDEKAQTIMAACSELPIIALATEELAQLMGGLSIIDSLICSDGGAMHLAAGLGKPIVCLFGDSDARHWYPWGVPYRLLQAPERHVDKISAEEVMRSYAELKQECDH